MAEGDRPGHPAARAGQVAPPATSTRRVASSHGAGDVGEFVRDLDFSDLPADVVAQAERCLLDLIGVAAAGSRTRASAIANGYAATQMCGADRDARILFDGRRASLAGAAFAAAGFAGRSILDASSFSEDHRSSALGCALFLPQANLRHR